MKDKIALWYQKNNELYEGEIDTKEFLNHMKYLREAFPDNNEVSTKLISLIPDMKYIFINQDLNDTQDTPNIQYLLENNKSGMIKIRRNHRIIWGFLQYYCDYSYKI